VLEAQGEREQLRSLGFSAEAKMTPCAACGSTWQYNPGLQLQSAAARSILLGGPELDNGNSG